MRFIKSAEVSISVDTSKGTCDEKVSWDAGTKEEFIEKVVETLKELLED